jgi:hypothetical protein
MTSNYLLYRLLEGYLPPFSWLIFGLRHHRRRFMRLKSRYDALMKQWESAAESGKDFPIAKQSEATRLRRTLVTYYPSTKKEIMPTRFGNAIRSFEVYPRELYGVDSVPVWLRLASVIPRDYMALLDDARAQVDCFVNLTFLALLIALASLVDASYEADWHALSLNGILVPFNSASLRHIACAAGSSALAVIMYYWATERVIAWGGLDRSAFDCYLPAVLKQLGFAILPTDAERRDFWSEFSALITYEQAMTTDRWPLRSELGAPMEPKAISRPMTPRVLPVSPGARLP